MNLRLATLTIVTSLVANSALAFDVNLTWYQAQKMLRKPMVEDLTVGVKGLVGRGNFCVLDGQLFLWGGASLETDPSKYAGHFNIVLQPDGAFQADFVPAREGRKNFSGAFPHNDTCPDEAVEIGLYPISSINGSTDMLSFVEYLIKQGYR